MKLFKIISATLLSATILSSCNDSPIESVEWVFTDYDHSMVTVTYDYQYFIQGNIVADADYSGEMLLTCTNYPMVSTTFGENALLGIKTTNLTPTTIKISFYPVDREAVADSTICIYIQASQTKNKVSYSNFNISRK